MGIGKTTAIRALCGDTVVDCDVPNLDVGAHHKATTTVGAEFGIVCLSNHEELHVYGSPGQERFGFLRQWLLSSAVGTLVLVDINQPGALPYATELVAQLQRLVPGAATVVAVGAAGAAADADELFAPAGGPRRDGHTGAGRRRPRTGPDVQRPRTAGRSAA